jgi:AraC-like DNA-binding protein
VIVCLRSDAASRIVGAPLKEFVNKDIHLAGLFGSREVALCDEMLAEASTSEERVAGIQSFLLRHLRPAIHTLGSRAAMHLRRNPTTHMRSLAAKLGCSTRHLSRSFKAAFGISPKRFARLARFQKMLAVRRSGWSWGQVAYACGLTDQAHLVKEFQDIIGESPTELLGHACMSPEVMDEANVVIQLDHPASRATQRRSMRPKPTRRTSSAAAEWKDGYLSTTHSGFVGD